MNSKVKKIMAIIAIMVLFFGAWKFFSYKNSLSAASSKARDEKRVEDFQNFRLSLTLYFVEHDIYPDNLKELLPRYLSEIAQDPREGEKHGNSECESVIKKDIFLYDYQPIDFQKKFTLSACLEDGKILTISQ